MEGTLEFLGRVDQQVKVRGVRIDTAEIEAISAATRGFFKRWLRRTGRRRVTFGSSLISLPSRSAAPTVQSLRQYLGERLPESVVPSAFVRLDRLPTLGQRQARPAGVACARA